MKNEQCRRDGVRLAYHNRKRGISMDELISRAEVMKHMHFCMTEDGKVEGYVRTKDILSIPAVKVDSKNVDLISRQDAIKTAHLPTIEDAGYEVIRLDDILTLPAFKGKTKRRSSYSLWVDHNEKKDIGANWK